MKKQLIITFITTIMLLISTPDVFANETSISNITLQNPDIFTEYSSEISPYADIIEYKYRINTKTKKQQYRRWNRTRGYWVDPDWIDIP